MKTRMSFSSVYARDLTGERRMGTAAANLYRRRKGRAQMEQTQLQPSLCVRVWTLSVAFWPIYGVGLPMRWRAKAGVSRTPWLPTTIAIWSCSCSPRGYLKKLHVNPLKTAQTQMRNTYKIKECLINNNKHRQGRQAGKIEQLDMQPNLAGPEPCRCARVAENYVERRTGWGSQCGIHIRNSSFLVWVRRWIKHGLWCAGERNIGLSLGKIH